MISFIRKTMPALAAAGCLAVPAFAGTAEDIAAASTTHTSEKTGWRASLPEPTSEYDRLWNHFIIVKNDSNPVLQELSFQGRLQLQYAWGDSDEGEYYSGDRPNNVLWDDIEVRRWRLGFKSKWFQRWKLDGQIDVNADWDPFYRQIYDLTLTFAPSDAFNIGIGKYKANNFGIEQFTSSKEILTMERSMLSNQLFPGELTGARITGKKENLQYAVGAYSGDITQEFSAFETGGIFQGSIGYDFHEKFGLEKALVKLDLQYSDDIANGRNVGNEPRLSATTAGRYGLAWSLNGHFEQDKWNLYTDILGAEGRGVNGDVWGVIIMPSYYLSKSLQIVARYQYASGDNDGLQLQSRYERLAVPPGGTLTDAGRGENYHAFYLGLNYYLYGHKLKIMGGAEYHDMDNGNDNGGAFEGVTGWLGMRMFF